MSRRGHVHGQPGGGVGVVGVEQEEVRKTAQLRVLAGVDPVRVGDHPGPGGLPEAPGRPHRRQKAARVEQVPHHLRRPRAAGPPHTAMSRKTSERGQVDDIRSPLVLALVGLGVGRARIRQETEKWNVGAGHGLVAW